MRFKIFAFLLLSITSNLFAAPASKLLPEWESAKADSSLSVDHSIWQSVLDDSIQSANGINLINYEQLSSNRDQLDTYIKQLGNMDPRELNKNEQFAYWVNLYNAATVQLIVDNYPVKSIKKIKDGFLSFGPWDRQWINVVGETLSLNNIEHGILRPLWNDPRIHYAVNCASIGCPNLMKTAFTADNTEAQLEQASRDFINHPRGVSVNLDNNKIIYSSIYHWYKIDFGNSLDGLLSHWKQYATPELSEKLNAVSAGASPKTDHDYDWNLNSRG